MANLEDRIEHVVVLMLENRAFDSMLGRLYADRADFSGLTGSETNPLQGGKPVRVWEDGKTDPDSMSIPSPDPGELWCDINMQIFGLDGRPGNPDPPMNGFVDNYVRQKDDPGPYPPESIMHHYTPEQLPVLSGLAKAFAVCDEWHASAPCQTWPNRFFLHCSTANGYENNSPIRPPYLMSTIFNRMSEKGRDWKIYFHDFPQTLTLADLWTHLDHFRFYEAEFLEDAEKGKLPAYTFIEPRYFPDHKLPNDQHPPHHVGMGEDLIAEVYNAVRNSPVWNSTLLIVTYDEHGGIYDHVPPPAALPPDDTHPRPFGFDRYGVRVPAVLVSPYIKAGTVLKRPEGSPYPYDHTSVIATLRKGFDLGGPLSRRDAVAPDLGSVLNLDAPRQDCPVRVTPREYTLPDGALEKALNAPLNGFQKAMHEAAAHLPDLKSIREGESVFSTIENHIGNFVRGIMKEVPDHRTPKDAVPFMKEKLKGILG